MNYKASAAASDEAAGLNRIMPPGRRGRWRTDQGQIVVGVDPIARGELLEQGAVETTRDTIVEVFDGRLLAELGGAQPRRQPFVAPPCRPALEQQSEQVVAIELLRLAGFGEFDEGFGHSISAEGVASRE